jgi:hypothetical protein
MNGYEIWCLIATVAFSNGEGGKDSLAVSALQGSGRSHGGSVGDAGSIRITAYRAAHSARGQSYQRLWMYRVAAKDEVLLVALSTEPLLERRIFAYALATSCLTERTAHGLASLVVF